VIPPQRPLVVAALAYLAALLLSLRFSPEPLPLLIAAAGALVTASLPRFARRSPDLVLAALALCGLAAGGAAVRAAARDCRAALPDGAVVRVSGVLGAGAFPGGASPPLLPLEAVTAEARGGACAGDLRVRLPPVRSPLPAGTGVEMRGVWLRSGAPLARPVWPLPPLYAGFVAGDSLVRVRSPSAAHPLLALRGRSEAALRRLFPRDFPLADALLLGRREWVGAEVRDRFASAGLSHLLAISGMHVGLLAGVLLLVLGALRLSHARRTWVTLALLAGYLALIGAPASAVRSGIMLSLALWARLIQRPSAALPIVAAAALLQCAAQPLVLLEPGFQLSFAGVLGLVASRAVPRPELPRGILRRLGRPVIDSLVVSLVAFGFTAPIVAYHFGVLAPVSVLANLPAVPLLGLALVGIAAALVAAPLLPPVARLLADGAGLALSGVDRVAALAALAPAGHFGVGRPGALAVLAALAAAPAAWALLRAARRGVRAAVAGGCALSLLLAAPVLDGRGAGALEIHFIDVGQGDAIAIHTPGDHWLLVDAGPLGRESDAGRRRVLPFLRAHGARRLEALVLTHPDADHVGGAVSVLRGIPVRRVVEPGLPVGKDLYRELLTETEVRGVPWTAARAGRVLRLDGVEIDLLWPDERAVAAATEANEVSVVARVSLGGFAALLTGDAPEEVERTLVARHGVALRAQVLKAGHHGSATSTSGELRDAVRPELVVVSVGRRNRYGHPAPEVLERLRRRGIDVARTDLESTVSIRVDPRDPEHWSRVER
jgi:competence protein ComEC